MVETVNTVTNQRLPYEKEILLTNWATNTGTFWRGHVQLTVRKLLV